MCVFWSKQACTSHRAGVSSLFLLWKKTWRFLIAHTINLLTTPNFLILHFLAPFALSYLIYYFFLAIFWQFRFTYKKIEVALTSRRSNALLRQRDPHPILVLGSVRHVPFKSVALLGRSPFRVGCSIDSLPQSTDAKSSLVGRRDLRPFDWSQPDRFHIYRLIRSIDY